MRTKTNEQIGANGLSDLFGPYQDVILAPVEYNCCEGVDIHDGDYVIVDLARKPEPGEACLCTIPQAFDRPCIKVFEGTLGGKAFAVAERRFGRWPEVPTGQPQQGYCASAIHGTVVACLQPRWVKPALSSPQEAHHYDRYAIRGEGVDLNGIITGDRITAGDATCVSLGTSKKRNK